MAFVSLPSPIQNLTASTVLVSDSNGLPVSAGITATQLAAGCYWQKYTVAHTALKTADVVNNITLFSLPALACIQSVIIRPTTAFAGTATYTISIGIAGTLTKYTAASDVKATVTATLMYTVGTSFVPVVESFSGATDIKISAVSTVQNLSSSSAGSVDVYVLVSQFV